MSINSLEELIALRRRVLEGEKVTQEELREALQFARQSRTGQTAKKKPAPSVKIDLSELLGLGGGGKGRENP